MPTEETNVTPAEGELVADWSDEPVLWVDPAEGESETIIETVLPDENTKEQEDEPKHEVNSNWDVADWEAKTEEQITPEQVNQLSEDLDKTMEEINSKPVAEEKPVNHVQLHYEPKIPSKEDTNQRIITGRRGEERIPSHMVGRE